MGVPRQLPAFDPMKAQAESGAAPLLRVAADADTRLGLTTDCGLAHVSVAFVRQLVPQFGVHDSDPPVPVGVMLCLASSDEVVTSCRRQSDGECFSVDERKEVTVHLQAFGGGPNVVVLILPEADGQIEVQPARSPIHERDASNVVSKVRIREIVQPFAALAARCWKISSVAPGTVAVTAI